MADSKKKSRSAVDVEFRDFKYAEKLTTNICEELPSVTNPFVADKVRTFGYDNADLIRSGSFIDTFFLLLTGELPCAEKAELLEKTLCAFSNLGPRNNATRAAITAGVSRAYDTHILPIGMLVMGGTHQGAGNIFDIVTYLHGNISRPVSDVIKEVVSVKGRLGDGCLLPGFGDYFGTADPVVNEILECLLETSGAWEYLSWGKLLQQELKSHNVDQHWLREGVFAAVCCELGIRPIMCAALFQFCCAPGLIAHGFEHAGKPTTVLPFVKDDDYEIC